MTDDEAAELQAPNARAARTDPAQQAGKLARTLNRTADALQHSAELAETHAQRRERAGHSDEAAEERETAERASQAAQRARRHAKEIGDLSKGPAPAV